MGIEIRRVEQLDAPVERVWTALTEAEEASMWNRWSNIQAEPGREFRMLSEPNDHWDGIIRCQILEADPPRRLMYSWQLTGHDVHRVEWTLEPSGSGTRITVVHTGFAPDWALRGMVTDGYRDLLTEALPAYLLTGERQGAPYDPTKEQLTGA